MAVRPPGAFKILILSIKQNKQIQIAKGDREIYFQTCKTAGLRRGNCSLQMIHQKWLDFLMYRAILSIFWLQPDCFLLFLKTSDYSWLFPTISDWLTDWLTDNLIGLRLIWVNFHWQRGGARRGKGEEGVRSSQLLIYCSRWSMI